jgi:hypothetical protein
VVIDSLQFQLDRMMRENEGLRAALGDSGGKSKGEVSKNKGLRAALGDSGGKSEREVIM